MKTDTTNTKKFVKNKKNNKTTNTSKKYKVNRETNIAELVDNYPEAVDVLMAFGLHCVGCFASQFDTIGEGAMIHGMMDEEIDEMIDEVNLVLNQNQKNEK